MQKELNVPWHRFEIVSADSDSAVVPNDDGEFSMRLAGAF
jgi:hypothetical protein